MEDEPVLEGEGRLSRFRRLPAWKKAALAAGAFVVLLFVAGAVLPVFMRGQERASYMPSALSEMSGAGLNVDMSKVTPERLEAARKSAEHARARLMEESRPSEFGLARGAGRPATAVQPLEAAGVTPYPGLETWGRQLILNASLALEVPDVRAAYDRAQVVAASEGALITSASLQAGAGARTGAGTRGGYGHASLVLRMPQSRFYSVRRRLESLAPELGGKLLRDEISSEDVTEEYVDLKARQRHWQSQEAQLLEIMRQARRISDILAVRNQLSEVQQEIERITGRLRFLENRVDLSTITVEIYQKGKGPTPPTIASTWRKAGKAVAAAAMRSLRDTVYLFGVIVAALTYIIPFAVILALLWVIVRAARRKPQPATRA
jgi:hypothetical protein